LRVHLDCIPCFLRQALEAASISTDDRGLRERALRSVVSYLSREDWNKSTAEVCTNVHRTIKKVLRVHDPYKRLKEEINRKASSLYPNLRKLVEDSEDPFLTAVKVAIAGNAIDLGPKIDVDIEDEVNRVLKREFIMEEPNRLKSLALKYRRILYLADNAGETFFDRILVEELTRLGVEITYAVKGGPILNDATFEDAEASGITRLARVVSTGTDCIGLLLNECSEDFLEEFKSSPLIISKGQGNYESLSEVKGKRIFFLLKVKCRLVAEDLDVELGTPVLKYRFG